MRFVVAVLIVSFLGCSGLLEPSGRVVGVDASCGAVALQVEPDGPAGVAPIQVDGAPVQTVRLDGLPVTVQLPMGAGRHEVQVGGGPPAVVDVPNNDLTLKVRTPSEAPLEGEPARVVVQVLGSCPTEGLVLGTSVAASGASSLGVASAASGACSVSSAASGAASTASGVSDGAGAGAASGAGAVSVVVIRSTSFVGARGLRVLVRPGAEPTPGAMARAL